MDNFFKYSKRGSSLTQEIMGGIIVFLAMSYILPVNANILSSAGADYNAIFFATAICSGICCILMGLFANIPNFVLGALTVFFTALVLATGESGVLTSFVALFNLIMRFHASMYLGFISEIIPHGLSQSDIDYVEFLIEAILFTVLPIISVAITHLAYTLGSHEKKIFSFLTGKK